MDAAILTNTAEAANAKPMFVTYSYGSGSATDVNKVLSADDGVLKTWNPSSGQLAIAYEGSDQTLCPWLSTRSMVVSGNGCGRLHRHSTYSCLPASTL